MSATPRLQKLVRSPVFALVGLTALLATALVVVGTGAPVPGPPTAVLVLACALLGVAIGDETLHPGALVGLSLVALDQHALGTGSGSLALVVVLPWLVYRACCRWVAGPMRRFHGWLPARPTTVVWPWPAAWLVLSSIGVATAALVLEGPVGLAALAGQSFAWAALSASSTSPGRPATARQAARAALALAVAQGATVSVARQAAAPWELWAAIGAGAALGAAAGALAGRSGRLRALWTRLRPAAGVPAFATWIGPALATAVGAAYALMGGEGGEDGRAAAFGLVVLVVGAVAVGTPIAWGLEYGLADWVRRRRDRPQPVAGLDLLRAELVTRPWPRAGRPPFRLVALDGSGRRLAIELGGAVCLNDRSHERQEPVHWLCPLRAVLELSGRLDEGSGRVLVSEADGGWIRALPARREASLSRRGVAVGLRMAAGVLVIFGAAELLGPRLAPRYSPDCRELYLDPRTMRAPLVQPDRCSELLEAMRPERAGAATTL